MRKFHFTRGGFVPVERDRVETPEGTPGSNVLQDTDGSVLIDGIGEWLELDELGPGHITIPHVHSCRTERGGTMTIKPPEYFLVASNPDIGIVDLFEDETGSVVVDDLLETLALNL